MPSLLPLAAATLRGILRDRILVAILGAALLIILLVPVFSLFSMRQVQELAITLSLSMVSLVLLVVSLLIGSSTVWRDIERRYTASVLTLPISRAAYLLGKYLAVCVFIALCGVALGLVSVPCIVLAAGQYPSEVPIQWGNIAIAVGADIFKYIFLAALAFFFSSFGTSFFLPFFCSLAVFLAGSASQEVFEYVSGQYGREMTPLSVALIKGVYYIIPNFSAFDLKVQAIYGIPPYPAGLALTLLYAAVYVSILLFLAVRIFSRRELP